ncbi:MAG: cryptochrome/photolyase family protein [Pseudomonadota bacterium]
MSVKNLILVLGDQLTPTLTSLSSGDPDSDLVLMGELADETGYVRHHKKKIAFIFSAMRHFARALEGKKWRVEYHAFDRDSGVASFTDLVVKAVDAFSPERIIVTEPGEWRLLEEFKTWADRFSIPVDILEDRRFICSHDRFAQWADGKKALRMEFFYREMRRDTGLLLDDGDPAGGQWNFDADNRKPPSDGLSPPPPKRFRPDAVTKDVLGLVEEHFDDHFGDLDSFWFGVTQKQAEAAFDHFVETRLSNFGDYQDAMLRNEKFLYHSLISMYLNVGLLDPLEICRRAEDAYRDGTAPLNAVEGFIRQVIGWREYVRGIYWREGPDYVRQNFLGADRALPSFYWSGETDMACVAAAVDQTREEAYAHHIQRLMVTGTFALIAGVDPHEVHEWYLAVYADAFEWVEAPNVIGMSQFADGGILGSKPYAASGAYINRMSDYCSDCAYSVSKKTEDDACPFNALYWDFLLRNEEQLRGNPRLSRVYQNWARMADDKQSDYRKRAKAVLKTLDEGGRL